MTRTFLSQPSRRVASRKNIYLLVLLLTLLVVFFYILVRISWRQEMIIDRIIVKGSNALNQNKIKSITNLILADNYLYFFPKRNVYLYPQKQLASSITTEISKISEVSIRRQDKTLVISLQERQPAFIFCINESTESIAKKCFYADKDGLVFDLAPEFSGDIFFEFERVLGQPDSQKYLGSYILSKDDFESILFFKTQIDSLLSKYFPDNSHIIRVVLDKYKDYRYIISNKGNYAWSLLFNLEMKDKKAGGQNYALLLTENLETTISSPFFQSAMKSQKREIDYIDLRFDGKIFYKFKN